jgi:predicted dehydrogenase
MIAPMPKKVGIIGAGVIGDFHAEALNAMPGAQLVAAYARRDERAQAFAQAHGCSAYSDLGQFLAHEGMDVVTVASVSGAHLDHVQAGRSGRGNILFAKSHWR